MLWFLVLVPMLGGVLLWSLQPAWSTTGERVRRRLSWLALALLVTDAALAVWLAVGQPTARLPWGPDLVLQLSVTPPASVIVVLVPIVAAPIVLYAVAYEARPGLERLVGLLVVFVGVMQLLLVADDLLTLLVGWEGVGAVSWALIAHQWRDPWKPKAAAHAFNATRAGDLGLFAAAGAAFAGVDSLGFPELTTLQGWPLHVLVAGIVLAAIAKSAQGPFAAWLFSAMAGPTPVSALLHAATMVAAGAYVLVRLHPVLSLVTWFAPVVITVGLATALTGGVVAAIQPEAKKLLAASTSAQYGLMFVAVGAGFPAAAGTQLITHAFFKALLFLGAGLAIAAVGSEQLRRMRLGSSLPLTAALVGVGSLGLAAVPPLGGAWSKEQLVAAAGQRGVWLAIMVIAAGGLSAFYAARFQLAAFGRTGPARSTRRPGTGENVALGVLAALSVGLGALWLPGAHGLVGDLFGTELAGGQPWELPASLAVMGAGLYGAMALRRRKRLATLGVSPQWVWVADWFGLPALVRAGIVAPVLALCTALARTDDRVIDAGVRGAAATGRLASRVLRLVAERDLDRLVGGLARAALRSAGLSRTADDAGIDRIVAGIAGGVGGAGHDARRLQTGYTHHYYVVLVVGVLALLIAIVIWR